METLIVVGVGALGALVGALSVFALGLGSGSKEKLEEARIATEEARKNLSSAKKEAQTITKEARLEAREIVIKAGADFDRKMAARKKEIDTIETRLIEREKQLDKRSDQLDRRSNEIGRSERSITEAKKRIEKKEARIDQTLDERLAKLEEIAQMSSERAKEELRSEIFKEARREATEEAMKIEREALASATEKANYVIANTIQRIASDYVAENTVSVIDLPNDEMKGRVIGREGRNIRALEEAAGVELIIDDTPNAVVISCFDPIRREIASQALTRLVQDGRIHPGRIESVISKVTSELEQYMRSEAEKAIFELRLDSVHPELVKILGRLRYRTSHSQNVLRHSVEVGFISGMMAAQLGLNAKLARRAGLLHDIGKALDQSQEGTHTQIGIELAKRYNEDEVVINSIASHHEEIPATSVISVLVAAADALSAARPGARKEMFQNYINRMRDLEEISSSFDGVSNSYAIQAGRELRVVVKPDSINDSESFFLAKDIAKRIESELSYPGEIKVTVIREKRVSEMAR